MVGRLALGCLLVVALTITAFGKELDPAEAKMVHDYPLTLDKVKAYNNGLADLNAAQTSDPSLKEDFEAASSPRTGTLADEVAKLDRHPRSYAYFAKRGLSKQDVVILPIALMSGCLVAQFSPAAAKQSQTSEQQSKFCEDNKAALDEMKMFNGR